MITFSRNKWLILLLAASQYIILSDYLIVMPMGPALISELGIGSNAFANLISIYSIGAVIIGLSLSGFLDRFDRLLELRIALSLFVVVSFLHRFADDYWSLFMLRFLSGGLAGICGSLVMSVISDVFDSNRRGRVIGIVLGSTSLVQVVGIPMGLMCVNQFGWQTPFLVNALFGAVVLTLLILVRVRTDHSVHVKEHKNAMLHMLSVIQHPYHFKGMICSLLTMFSGTIVVAFLPLLLVYQYKIPEAQLGTVYLIGGILAFLLSLLAGRIAEIGSGRLAIYMLFSLGACSLMGFILFESMPLLMVIGLFALVNALYLVRMIPLNRFVLEYIAPDYLGGFQSVNTALLHIGASIAAWSGGVIVRIEDGGVTGFSSVSILSIAILIILFPIIHLGFSKRKHVKQ